jgi:hypothetical protein
VVLGVDGVFDFNGLHSRKHEDEVQFCAFDILVEAVTICASCRSRCGSQPGAPARAQAGVASSSTRSSAARSGPISSTPHLS